MWTSLKEIANSDVEAIHGPDRTGDIRDSLADISKAKNGFGYEPKFRLHDGLKVTFDWFILDKNLTNK